MTSYDKNKYIEQNKDAYNVIIVNFEILYKLEIVCCC